MRFVKVFCLVSLGFVSTAWAEPSCSAACACTPLYIPVQHTDQLTYSGPYMGLFGSTVWNQYSSTNCCGSTSGNVTVGQHTVSVGFWTKDTNGLDIGPLLPEGFACAAGNQMTFEGSTSKTIPAQTAASFTLGSCQSASYKVGPGYTIERLVQQMSKICLKDVGQGCSLLKADLCAVLDYTGTVTAKYLTPDVMVDGAAGVPWSGCSQCANPAQPTC